MSVRKCTDHARAPANLADDRSSGLLVFTWRQWLLGNAKYVSVSCALASTSAALVRRIALSFTITSRTLSSAERRSLLGVNGLQHSSDVATLPFGTFLSVSV